MTINLNYGRDEHTLGSFMWHPLFLSCAGSYCSHSCLALTTEDPINTLHLTDRSLLPYHQRSAFSLATNFIPLVTLVAIAG